MRRILMLAGALALASPAFVTAEEGNDMLVPDLSPPVRVMAGTQPIDVEIGHAAPWLADMDGDGVTDLLVGQFGDGKCRLYRNSGTNQQPVYASGFTFIKAGGDFAKVPFG